MSQSRDASCFVWGVSRDNNKNCLHSGYILKMGFTASPNGLNLGYEKEGQGGHPKFQMHKWKDKECLQ